MGQNCLGLYGLGLQEFGWTGLRRPFDPWTPKLFEVNGLLELFGIFETLNFEALFGSWIGFVSLAVFGPLVPNPVVLFLSFEAFDPMVLF